MLGLFELAFLFALILALLTSGGPALLLSSTGLSRDGLVLAAMLTMTIAGTAATIGLYRPEVCFDRGRFVLTGTIAAVVAFPAILLVSGAYRMTLNSEHIVWLARLLVIWLPFVLLVRFALSARAMRMPVSRRLLIVGEGARAGAMAAAGGKAPRFVRADCPGGFRRGLRGRLSRAGRQSGNQAFRTVGARPASLGHRDR